MTAGSTYTPISTTTLGSAQASVTFSSFSGYTDLVLIVNGLLSSTDGSAIYLTFNGAGSTGRSYTRLQGNGSTASSLRASAPDASIGVLGNSDGGNLIINVMNYSISTRYKTILSRYNSLDSGDGRTGAYVGLWANTDPITSLTIAPNGVDWASGSTFTLYGIAAA